MGTVSVILPFRNAEFTLKTAIESVLHQSFADFELILVNNASSDKSCEVAKSFLIDSRVSLIDEPIPGVVAAMNCGLARARSKWIARMDADDEWYSDKLENQLTFLNENPEVAVLGTQVQFQSSIKNATGLAEYVKWSNALTSTSAINSAIFIESPIVNPSVVFNRDLIENFGVYKKGCFPEDYEMFLRWHAKAVVMAKLDEEFMIWNDHPSRLTRSHSAYSTEAFNEIKCQYLAEWLKTHLENEKRIWIWGASRIMRRRAEVLEKFGIQIEGYIDIKRQKTRTKPCIHFTEIPKPGKILVISFVAIRKARDQVKAFLQQSGYVEMVDFVLAA